MTRGAIRITARTTTPNRETKSSDADLLAAIGPNLRAQGARYGFATTTYIKAHDQGLFFAGPQRSNLVCVSLDGKLRWQHKGGNYQLVLRDDALYAAGEQTGKPTSVKLDYATGRELLRFTDRKSCTRATGSIDSIFYRAKEGTVRFVPETGRTEHIAAMRPPCNSGVIISDGLLHWGPWVCGCRLSLFGDVCLGPAGAFDFQPKYDDTRREAGRGQPADPAKVAPLAPARGDWSGHRANLTTSVAVPEKVKLLWTQSTKSGPASPAATAGEWVFVATPGYVVRRGARIARVLEFIDVILAPDHGIQV